MTTIEVTVLADDDQDFVVTILDALARKHIIEFDHTNAYPAEGPILTNDNLVERVRKSEAGTQYSIDEAKARLGL